MTSESAASADLNKLRIDRSERRDLRTRRRSPWPLLLLLLTVGGGGAGGYYFYLKNYSAPEVSTTRVVLVTPSEGNALLTASGYVVAQNKVILGSKTPRRLVERFANEGDHVEKDNILARLDHSDVDARLLQARAAVASAEAVISQSEATQFRAAMAVEKGQMELNEMKTRLVEAQARRDGDEREMKRYRDAEKAGASVRKDRELAETAFAVSSSAYETVKQQIKTAEANVEWLKRDVSSAEADVRVRKALLTERQMEVRVAESAVEDTIIRAPFDGVILLKQAEVGESVSPGVVSGQVTSGSIFQIADFNTLEAEVDINESNVSKVRNGQPCEIQVDAVPDRVFRGRVRILMPGANRQKATVAAKVVFDERDARIRPELGCKVTFLREATTTQAAPRLLVPKSAVFADRGAQYVYWIQDGKLKKRLVETRENGGDRVEIVSGLREGEEIVQNATPELSEGALVRLKKL